MDQPRIAILGLGIMGRGIALNYLEHGYDVTVWNRSEAKTIELAGKGAKVAASPAEAGRESDFVIDVTASDESSRSVFADPESGVLGAARSDQTLITCGTFSLAWIRELNELCIQSGLTLFDMPMTGSRAGAESGELVLLVGGNKEKFKDVRPHLSPFSSEQRLFGDVGSGTQVKLTLNFMQAAQILTFGQAMRQMHAAGIETHAAGEFFITKPGGYGTAAAWNCCQNFPIPENFAVKWILKDLRYTREMVLDNGGVEERDMSMLEACIDALENAEAQGYGDYDWNIINRLGNPLFEKDLLGPIG